MKGLLLEFNNDLQISVKRDASGKITSGLVVGESKLQAVYMVLSLNQGDLKEDPIMGCNLVTMIRSKTNKEKIKKVIKVGLERAGINFDEIKEEINLMINKQDIDL